jgi:hypothetical protein
MWNFESIGLFSVKLGLIGTVPGFQMHEQFNPGIRTETSLEIPSLLI